MAVFITLCKCTVKIIYNHFKTWLGPGEYFTSSKSALHSPRAHFTYGCLRHAQPQTCVFQGGDGGPCP